MRTLFASWGLSRGEGPGGIARAISSGDGLIDARWTMLDQRGSIVPLSAALAPDFANLPLVIIPEGTIYFLFVSTPWQILTPNSDGVVTFRANPVESGMVTFSLVVSKFINFGRLTLNVAPLEGFVSVAPFTGKLPVDGELSCTMGYFPKAGVDPADEVCQMWLRTSLDAPQHTRGIPTASFARRGGLAEPVVINPTGAPKPLLLDLMNGGLAQIQHVNADRVDVAMPIFI